MIISELHIFEVDEEFGRRDAVELNQAFLGKEPKAFQPVHIDFSVRIPIL